MFEKPFGSKLEPAVHQVVFDLHISNLRSEVPKLSLSSKGSLLGPDAESNGFLSEPFKPKLVDLENASSAAENIFCSPCNNPSI